MAKDATRKGVSKAKATAKPKTIARTKVSKVSKNTGPDKARSAITTQKVVKPTGNPQASTPALDIIPPVQDYITAKEAREQEARTVAIRPPQPWDDLEDRHKAFAEEFIVDLNATQAYIRVYGGKELSAQANASRLIGNDKVRAYVEHLLRQRSERTNIRADKVLEGLARVAFADIRQLFDENGALRDLRTLPDDLAMAVQGVEIMEEYAGSGKDRIFIGYTKKIKLANRIDGLINLGKHLKLFTDVVEHKHEGKVEHEHTQVPTDFAALENRMKALYAGRAAA